MFYNDLFYIFICLFVYIYKSVSISFLLSLSYSGYDIEDAIILNKSYLYRGFARCVVSLKASTWIRIYPNQTTDRIVSFQRPPNMPVNKPDGVTLLPNGRYDRGAWLDVDGIVGMGQRLQPREIWCNKYVPLDTSDVGSATQTLDLSHYAPSPQCYNGPVPCIVDQVLLTSSVDAPLLVKALFRQVRRPEVGDKFSSRHGQKGVCGLIVEQADMPFTDQVCCFLFKVIPIKY